MLDHLITIMNMITIMKLKFILRSEVICATNVSPASRFSVGRLGPRHREIWFGSYGDWSGGPERELEWRTEKGATNAVSPKPFV